MTGAPPTPGEATPNLTARRLVHVGAGATFALAALMAPILWIRIAAVTFALGFALLDALRLAYPGFNRRLRPWLRPILKTEEQTMKVTGATYMLLAVALCLLLFEAEVAAAAILFLAVGDPIAGLVGQRLGRRRLGAKSIEGTLAFFASALLLGLALFWAGRLASPWLSVAGAGSAALAELIPLPIDDNVWIPLAAATAMSLTWLLIQ